MTRARVPRPGALRYHRPMPLAKLPGWVIDDESSVRAEVADWVNATAAERWDATRRCARAAARVLRFHADPARALEWVDPVPESTTLALARLRAARHG